MGRNRQLVLVVTLCGLRIHRPRVKLQLPLKRVGQENFSLPKMQNKFSRGVLLSYSEYVVCLLSFLQAPDQSCGQCKFCSIATHEIHLFFSIKSAALPWTLKKTLPDSLLRGTRPRFHIYVRFFYNSTTVTILMSPLCEKGREAITYGALLHLWP